MFLVDAVVMLIVHMHKRSFNISQPFELSLQRLTNIMGYFQRHVLTHNDVHFDVVLLTGMVGSTLFRNDSQQVGGAARVRQKKKKEREKEKEKREKKAQPPTVSTLRM